MTLAVFWAENPMVFTYTSLYTVAPATRGGYRPTNLIRPRSTKPSVAIVEPDEGCRLAVTKWLRGLDEYHCAGAYATGDEALRNLRRRPAELLLFNWQLPDMRPQQFLESVRAIAPLRPAFGYRVYSNSDELFMSQIGVSGGYYFRRRSPEDLLEPLRGAWQNGAPAPGEWVARIFGYVQKQFLFPQEQFAGENSEGLTSREHDILTWLRKGSTDKEIARALNISAWTVHTHLKRIYKKLGVRSRTEAVITRRQK
jgi:DNA-binding NarL/FixJ family response regulator